MKSDITQTTTTDFDTDVKLYSVDTQDTDGVTAQKETTYMNTKWTQQLGYFKDIPEFNRALTSLAIWTAGRGWSCPLKSDEVILNNIRGRGDETFSSIIINMFKVKNFAEDSYAEIIRNDKGTLINLKPLNTGKIKIVVNQQGLTERYEYQQGNGKFKKLKPSQIFRLSNDSIADEIHGTSKLEGVEWVILARNQLMADMKRISHLSSVRILYVDEGDKTRLAELKKELAVGIEKGSILIMTVKPGEAKFEDLTLPPIEAFLSQIRYYENFFYIAVGIPRVIATAEGMVESGAKVGSFNFEPVYSNERIQLEKDIWNQLAIRIKFGEQPTLTDNLNRDEGKDRGSLGFQPNDTTAGSGK